ncbi:MAG: hypothetical protein KAQ97_02565 [Candidatus Fermentibacteraceae bacterium]|nr:hypothetical protein [Candidatus Fermentibacteraceae bacterium]
MMMKTLLLVILLPALVFAVSLDGWIDFQTGGDSLSPEPGKLELGGMLRSDNWTLIIEEQYSHDDSSGIVQRILKTYSQTDVDFIVDVGPVTINPDLCWTVDLGDKPELVLPVQAGVVYREGFIRPGLSLTADISEGMQLFARGLYWNRDLRQEDDFDLAWTESRVSGGISSETQGFTLSMSGLYHKTNSDFIDYESTWSRFDIAFSTEPQSLPANFYVTGDVTYSFYNGTNYLGDDLADRISSRIRLVRMIIPSIAVNTTFESVIDYDGEIRSACTSAESRILYRFMRSREVPSVITLSGKLSSSSIRTERAALFSRINFYRGLSLLLNAEARSTPTMVAGAGDTRKRIVFGPGLEYQIGTTLRVWGIIEQERTDLEEVEVWWRVRTGLEFYPGSLTL